MKYIKSIMFYLVILLFTHNIHFSFAQNSAVKIRELQSQLPKNFIEQVIYLYPENAGRQVKITHQVEVKSEPDFEADVVKILNPGEIVWIKKDEVYKGEKKDIWNNNFWLELIGTSTDKIFRRIGWISLESFRNGVHYAVNERRPGPEWIFFRSNSFAHWMATLAGAMTGGA